MANSDCDARYSTTGIIWRHSTLEWRQATTWGNNAGGNKTEGNNTGNNTRGNNKGGNSTEGNDTDFKTGATQATTP